MTTNSPASDEHSAAVGAYVRTLREAAAQLRVPELMDRKRSGLYRMHDRNGVTTVAFRTMDLAERELVDLMRYRLAQYLAVNFVDAGMVYECRMEYEPLATVGPDHVHIIAIAANTGEILCYLTIGGPGSRYAGTTLRERDRPLLPVEQFHGWGVFNRLRVIADLPLSKVVEIGRFVKNQRLDPHDELVFRAPIEVCVAASRLLTGPLRQEVDAVVGDLEEGVSKQNLLFFNVPLVVIHGTVSYAEKASYKYAIYRHHSLYPFAFLVSDFTPVLDRTTAIESALTRPGHEGGAALLALRTSIHVERSSLEPAAGLDPLTDQSLADRQVTMSHRRVMRDLGDWVRSLEVFHSLTTNEAVVLATFMEQRDMLAGDVLDRRGSGDDALFVIKSGKAELRTLGTGDQSSIVAVLGPGDYFGEMPLVTGEPSLGQIVAATPITLLRIDKDSYAQFLAHNTDVGQHLARTAARRASRMVEAATIPRDLTP
jgi:CRP-like cAMP-binding protein